MICALDPNGIYLSADVARWLRYETVEYFYRAKPALEKTTGFPKPISPRGRPRWRGKTLLDWAERAAEYEAARQGARGAGSNILDFRTEQARLAACGKAVASSPR